MYYERTRGREIGFGALFFSSHEQGASLQRTPRVPVRGKVDFFDGTSSQTLLDLLEVPQRNRTAGTFRRLSKLMTESRGGYREQVRGYCREARGQCAVPLFLRQLFSAGVSQTEKKCRSQPAMASVNIACVARI
jgi:hypothetical protein